LQSRNNPNDAKRKDLPPKAPKSERPWNWKAIAFVLISAVLIYGTIRLVRHYWGDSDYRSAESALERRDFKQASLLLAAHLKENPDDLRAILLAARTARRQN